MKLFRLGRYTPISAEQAVIDFLYVSPHDTGVTERTEQKVDAMERLVVRMAAELATTAEKLNALTGHTEEFCYTEVKGD